MNKTEKWNFLQGNLNYSIENKRTNEVAIINNILNKTLGMFNYENLPDSLPLEELEKILQSTGKAFIFNYDGNIVAVKIDLIYDDIDIYGRPLKGNVYLQDKKELITMSLSDGVLISNDYLQLGLLSILEKYSKLINESESTLYIANIWKRASKLITASDDLTLNSAKTFINKMEQGEIGIISTNPILDSFNVASESVSNVSMSDLIQYDNYFKSLLYNEIGLSYNKQMKKERLITSEVEQEQESNKPFIENMLSCRNKGIEQVNKKFDLDIMIDISKSWRKSKPVESESVESESVESVESVEEGLESGDN